MTFHREISGVFYTFLEPSTVFRLILQCSKESSGVFRRFRTFHYTLSKSHDPPQAHAVARSLGHTICNSQIKITKTEAPFTSGPRAAPGSGQRGGAG